MRSKNKLFQNVFVSIMVAILGIVLMLAVTGCTNEVKKITVPTATVTNFVYNGEAQGISIAASTDYTITGAQKSTGVGEYTVTISLSDKAKSKWSNNTTDDISIKYTITKATNAWITEYAVPDLAFGTTPTVTNVAAKFGDVIYGYYSDEACENVIADMTGFSETTPIGTYYVKVSVVGTDNYDGLSYDEPFVVVVSQGVATAEALRAALENTHISNIKLMADIEVDFIIAVNRPITLDLNGKKIIVAINNVSTANGAVALRANAGGILIINDSVGTGKIDASYAAHSDIANSDYVVAVGAMGGGEVVINGGTVVVDTNRESAVYLDKTGNVTINGGTFTNLCTEAYLYGGGVVLTVNVSNKGVVGNFVVNGGTFNGRSPELGDDNLGGNFVATGKAVFATLVGNGTYIVAGIDASAQYTDYAAYYNKDGVTAEVKTEAGFGSMLKSKHIKFKSNIAINASVLNAFSNNSNGVLVINLNNYELKLNENSKSVILKNGVNLTIKNGKFLANNVVGTSACIEVLGGSTITLDNVITTSTGSVLLPRGDAAAVNIFGGSITTTGVYAISTNSNIVENSGVVIM